MGDVVGIADLTRAASWDTLARLSSDPSQPHSLGTGNGVTTGWDTPFTRASSLKGYVDGAVVTGTTLSRGTGAAGVDQITFSTAPATGKPVAVTADALAVNTAVVNEAITDAEKQAGGAYSRVGRAWPPTGTALEAERPFIEDLTVALLRERRTLEPTKRDERAFKHFDDIAMGRLLLPADAPAVAAYARPTRISSMPRIFDGELL